MASMINKAKASLHARSDKKTVIQNEHDQGVQLVETTPTDPSPAAEQSHEPKQESNGQTAGSDEESNGVEIHNHARSAKNLSHMSWDPSLAQEATAYAENLARKGQMQHSGTSGQGENLYMSTGDASFSDAVQSWLDEEKDYKGEKVGEGDFAKWGHFSQCMWHSTTKVGLGKAKSSEGATFIVGRYTPQGNMAGEKPFDT